MYKTLLVLILFVWQSKEDIIAKQSERIVGGYNVSIERVPHFVQILREGQCKCGGSILRREVVLTAAHCVYKDENLPDLLDPKDIQVIAGSDRRLRGTKITVHTFSVHPNYINTNNSRNYDIALLLLEKSLKYSNQIQPIIIANNMTQPLSEGTYVYVVGFGLTEEDGNSQPEHLQGIYLPKTNEQKCNEFLFNVDKKDYSTQLCLGNLSVENKDACDGDSGGPATYNEMLYGVVWWGDGCGRLGHPGIYGNLITLNGWIRQEAKDMGFPIS